MPDPAEVKDLLTAFPLIDDWINEARTAGRKVFLHCTAGADRSPTVGMAHLISRGMNFAEAEATVKKAHHLSWTTGDVDTLRTALRQWERIVSSSEDRKEMPREKNRL